MTQITQLGCAHCGARIHIEEPFKKMNREPVTCVVCKGLNELMVSEESEDVVFYFERADQGREEKGRRVVSLVDTSNDIFGEKHVKIWKYTLQTTDRQTVSMPAGARMLSVQVQHDRMCLWALVNDMTQKRVTRYIAIVETGEPFPEGVFLNFIGTCQFDGGELVYHVFEVS